MKKPKETKPCPMENCWQQIPSHHSFCPACTSWWHRIQMKDTHELAGYMQRMGRFSGRFNQIHNKSRRQYAQEINARVLSFRKQRAG